ncbi:hypothetical protein FOCC_FOCC013106 [Frankliniella occidentalis]|nr:hypothetical protein FOCC_FOCC013106 [Frankliniella occidentalis]
MCYFGFPGMFSLADYLLAIQSQNARQIDAMQLARPLQYHQMIGQANIAPFNGLMNPLLPVNNISGQPGLGFMGMGMGMGVGVLALQAQQAQQVTQTLQAADLRLQQEAAERDRALAQEEAEHARLQQEAAERALAQEQAEQARLQQEAAEREPLSFIELRESQLRALD